jgi:hypothetical protein
VNLVNGGANAPNFLISTVTLDRRLRSRVELGPRVENATMRNVKREVGDVIRTHTIAINTGEGVVLYWFEQPANFSEADAAALLDYINTHKRRPPSIILHGPFSTEAEVKEHQRVTLLGEQCEVRDGGAWDPKWDKPQ